MKNSLGVLQSEIERARQFSTWALSRGAGRPVAVQRSKGMIGRHPVSRASQATGKPWSFFFPFTKGTLFDVDGPLTYNGSGAVVENTATTLSFSLDMPALGSLDIPAAKVLLEITFVKEGTGNRARITVNGDVFEDDNVSIVSVIGQRSRTIRPSLKIPGFDWVRFAPDGDDEIDLDISVNGKVRDFDLERKKSSGQSRGARYSAARDAGATVAGVALGYNVLRDIASSEGDITWDLKALDGSYHPLHDGWSEDERKRLGAGPWHTRKETVHVAMRTKSTAEISATFELSFQYNGQYLANIDVEPVGTNDLVLWGLHVHGRIVKDAQHYFHPETGAGPFAHASYVFNFRFSGSVYEDKIHVARYELYGDGQLAWDRRWTQ